MSTLTHLHHLHHVHHVFKYVLVFDRHKHPIKVTYPYVYLRNTLGCARLPGQLLPRLIHR